MTATMTGKTGLLGRLRDGRDVEAWSAFVDAYGPRVYAMARRHGLQDADADDLTQDVLCVLARAAPRLRDDDAGGSFRGWFFIVARNCLRKFLRARRRAGATVRTGHYHLLLELPDRAEGPWSERDEQKRLLCRAAEQVRGSFRDTTWRAFWLTAIAGQDSEEVGRALGLSRTAVYIARCRVVARIREYLRRTGGEVPPPERGPRAGPERIGGGATT
jgi:RNA polymerase sigma-70 factor (ECF subfamily)